MKHVTETGQTSDQTYKRGSDVPLVLTYHPWLKNVNDIIKKYLVFLYTREQVENTFTFPPFVSFRVGFSLRKHLVRAKVYPHLREYESPGCNKSRCQTCLNVNNIDVFWSFATKESYKINHKFYCDSKCIIYLFSCKACRLQYVGSGDWYMLKDSAFFHQHFVRKGHHDLVNDLKLIVQTQQGAIF